MRLVFLALLLGNCAIAYQLFGSEGSVYRMTRLEQSLARQRAENAVMTQENEQLAAEVYSLENQQEAIEELARQHLYMVRPNEILVRLGEPEVMTPEPFLRYTSPELAPGSQPTFAPKNDDLYQAPSHVRAPKSRYKRE